MGFIDAHVHLWTDDTAHYPIAPGWKKEDMKDLGVSCQAFEEDAGPPPEAPTARKRKK